MSVKRKRIIDDDDEDELIKDEFLNFNPINENEQNIIPDEEILELQNQFLHENMGDFFQNSDEEGGSKNENDIFNSPSRSSVVVPNHVSEFVQGVRQIFADVSQIRYLKPMDIYPTEVKMERRNIEFLFSNTFHGIEHILQEKLYYHQKVGLNFLWKNVIVNENGAILADYMGLGKSLQVVSALYLNQMSNRRKPILLIVPKVTVGHWINEFELFSNWIITCRHKISKMPKHPLLEVATIRSKDKDVNRRIEIIKTWFDSKGVLIVNYTMFRLLCTMGYADIIDRFYHKDIIVILDEGHKIKTDKTLSQTSKVLSNLKTSQKIVLTGYPLQNNLLEYWYMIDFVRPNFLGTKERFKYEIGNPITQGQIADASEGEKRLSKLLGHILHCEIGRFSMRRGISLLRKTLPFRKHEIIVKVRMADVQITLYNELVTFLSLLKESKRNVLFWSFSLLTLLCNHPKILYDYCNRKIEDNVHEDDHENDSSFLTSSQYKLMKDNMFQKNKEEQIKSFFRLNCSNKMNILFRILVCSKRLNDKVVVFSKSLLSLTFCQGIIDNYNQESTTNQNLKLKYIRMDGSLSIEKRQLYIAQFNAKNSDIDFLLISTLSCCEGINLAAANRCVMLDINWNPAHDVEAESRIFRFGQRKDVIVYRLVCVNTIEEVVHNRQLQKERLLKMVCDDQRTTIEDMINIKDLLKLIKIDKPLDTVKPVDISEEIFDPVVKNCLSLQERFTIKSCKLHDSILREVCDEIKFSPYEIQGKRSYLASLDFFNDNEKRKLQKSKPIEMVTIEKRVEGGFPNDLVSIVKKSENKQEVVEKGNTNSILELEREKMKKKRIELSKMAKKQGKKSKNKRRRKRKRQPSNPTRNNELEHNDYNGPKRRRIVNENEPMIPIRRRSPPPPHRNFNFRSPAPNRNFNPRPPPPNRFNNNNPQYNNSRNQFNNNPQRQLPNRGGGRGNKNFQNFNNKRYGD